MSVLELEYSASNPERWNRYIRKHDGERDFMPPSVTHTFPIPDHVSQQGSFRTLQHQLKQLYLVPGGRFLVTLIKGRLQVWDLGITGSAELEPELIAETPSKGLFFSTHMTSDEEGLRIINSYKHDEEELWRCHNFEVFEIFPRKSDAELKLIATLGIRNQYPVDFTSVVGNIFICVFGPILQIWDFVTHGWITWNTGKPQSKEILATDKCIILIEYDGLSIWDIPALSYEVIGEYPTLEPHTVTQPRTRIAYPTNLHPPVDRWYFCRRLEDWYIGSLQPLWFDIIARVGFDYSCTHSLRRIKINIDDLDLPTLTSEYSFNVFGHERFTSFGSYRVCGDDISILTCDDTKVVIHTGSSSPGDNNHSFILFHQPTCWNRKQMSFCPVSGRLCYVSSMDVVVVDYSPSVFTPVSSRS